MRAVTVLAAGGTISSVDGGAGRPGAASRLDAAALVGAIPGLEHVEARSLLALNGSQLSLDNALTIARAACEEVEQGRGVVVTSGTDTIEELAVLSDAMCGDGPPVVFTGAIRPASAVGADGPANLADAVAVAAAAADGLGTVVCFAGELHAARAVRKVDSVAPHAFGSPRGGPIGRVVESRVEVDARPVRPAAVRPQTVDLRVPVVPTWLGDDGALLQAAVALEPDGVVLVALGAGHLPPPTLAALREAGDRVPVVATVRPERGAFLRETYGFEGAERDVLDAGVLPVGHLSAAAARMLLLAGLGAELDRDGLVALLGVGA
jgi:L-asparaginase